MKFEDFKALTPFQQSVILLLESLLEELKKVAANGEVYVFQEEKA